MSTPTDPAFPEWRVAAYAIGFVAVVLAIGAGKKLGLIEYSIATRAASAALGIILMIAGNYFPKFARPLNRQGGPSAAALAADRFAGRALVLAGLAYTALWLFAPFGTDTVKLASSSLVLGVFLLVAASQIRVAWRERQSPQGAPPGDTAPLKRAGIYLVLHALFWAFAIMLADFIWGDSSAVWVMAVFFVVNGVLTAWIIARRRQADNGAA